MREEKGHPFTEKALHKTQTVQDHFDEIIEAVGQREIQSEENGLYPRIQKERIPAVLYFTPPNETRNRLYINPQMEVHLGFPPAEWTDPGFWFRQLYAEDRERVLSDLYECLGNGNLFRSEYRLLGSDGHVVWVHDGRYSHTRRQIFPHAGYYA